MVGAAPEPIEGSDAAGNDAVIGVTPAGSGFRVVTVLPIAATDFSVLAVAVLFLRFVSSEEAVLVIDSGAVAPGLTVDGGDNESGSGVDWNFP